MQVKEVIDLVSDELRDSRNTKYSRTSLILKLKEAITQFVEDSGLLKKTVEIKPVAGMSVFDLPIFGQDFINWEGEAHDSSPSASTKVPTYLKLIRLSWKSLANDGENIVLHSNSTFERDEAGLSYYKEGKPRYYYNDELSFYQFGVWPVPDATALDNSSADNRLQLVYVSDPLYFTSATIQDDTTVVEADDLSDLLETHYLDGRIPIQFQRKIYLLVCHLRLKNSIDEIDVVKAQKYRELYQEELLAPALRVGAHMERYNQLKVMG